MMQRKPGDAVLSMIPGRPVRSANQVTLRKLDDAAETS
jgi:hypothetical protein